MTTQQKRHVLTEHIWRFIRAFFLISALIIWLISDGWGPLDWIISGLAIMAHLTEQFHGYMCNKIEKALGWRPDFDNWD